MLVYVPHELVNGLVYISKKSGDPIQQLVEKAILSDLEIWLDHLKGVQEPFEELETILDY
jgi:hypothetical protein